MTRRSSRCWDGTAETAAETRFFDLRDSGYRGPIDQDGYAVTSGREFEILQRLAESEPGTQ